MMKMCEWYCSEPEVGQYKNSTADQEWPLHPYYQVKRDYLLKFLQNGIQKCRVDAHFLGLKPEV
jgi:hypothetical protein